MCGLLGCDSHNNLISNDPIFHNFNEYQPCEVKAAPDSSRFFIHQNMKSSFRKAQSQKMTHPAETPHWKRTLDVVFILLTLPFVLPLAVLVAVGTTIIAQWHLGEFPWWSIMTVGTLVVLATGLRSSRAPVFSESNGLSIVTRERESPRLIVESVSA